MKSLSFIVVLLAVFAFTAYGFFIEMPCDIDKIYLWCNLHPMSALDYIGCTLFYIGAFFLTANPIAEKFELFNPVGSSMWNIIFFVGMGLGFAFIWI